MSTISFFALGGLDERDKKCFVLEVDKDCFIFNLGISTPNYSKLGVEKIVPDYTWIEKNKNRIKGIFISTAHFDNIGGMLYTNQIINNIPIYTSLVGKVIIENFLNKRSMKNIKNFVESTIIEVKPLEEIKVGSVSITPFSIFNSCPNSLGFIFNTNDGSVIILDDFIIGSNESKEYKNQIYEINKITNNKNLILISSVGNITKPYGFTSPNYDITNFLKSEVDLNINRRNFIVCYDSDLFSIIQIIKFAQKTQMNFSIYNNVLYNLLVKFLSLNIIDSKNISFIPISRVNQMEKGIVLLAYNKHKLFNIINSICMNNDEYISCKKNDKFIITIPTIAGFESIEAETIDLISYKDIVWARLPKNVLEIKASSEDHKLLVDYLNPKYIIPTSGLFFEFMEYKNIISNKEIKRENIIILENAKQIYFENGVHNKGKVNWLQIQEKYIGAGREFENINFSLLNERKLMSENGVVFISILMKKENNKFVVSDINIDSYGIKIDKVSLKEEVEKLEQSIIQMVVEGYDNKETNTKEIKSSIKRVSTKFYERFLGKTPLVLSTIIDRYYSN